MLVFKQLLTFFKACCYIHYIQKLEAGGAMLRTQTIESNFYT